MALTALRPGGLSGIRIWNRELATYPERDARRMHLLLVVLITVTLYYELYVGSGVATIMLAQLKIPFPIFVYILAAGSRSHRCWRGSLTGSDAPILWCTAFWWWG